MSEHMVRDNLWMIMISNKACTSIQFWLEAIIKTRTAAM